MTEQPDAWAAKVIERGVSPPPRGAARSTSSQHATRTSSTRATTTRSAKTEGPRRSGCSPTCRATARSRRRLVPSTRERSSRSTSRSPRSARRARRRPPRRRSHSFPQAVRRLHSRRHVGDPAHPDLRRPEREAAEPLRERDARGERRGGDDGDRVRRQVRRQLLHRPERRVPGVRQGERRRRAWGEAGGDDPRPVRSGFGELALLFNSPRSATVRCSVARPALGAQRDDFKDCVKVEGTRLGSHFAQNQPKAPISHDPAPPQHQVEENPIDVSAISTHLRRAQRSAHRDAPRQDHLEHLRRRRARRRPLASACRKLPFRARRRRPRPRSPPADEAARLAPFRGCNPATTSASSHCSAPPGPLRATCRRAEERVRYVAIGKHVSLTPADFGVLPAAAHRRDRASRGAAADALPPLAYLSELEHDQLSSAFRPRTFNSGATSSSRARPPPTSSSSRPELSMLGRPHRRLCAQRRRPLRRAGGPRRESPKIGCACTVADGEVEVYALDGAAFIKLVAEMQAVQKLRGGRRRGGGGRRRRRRRRRRRQATHRERDRPREPRGVERSNRARRLRGGARGRGEGGRAPVGVARSSGTSSRSTRTARRRDGEGEARVSEADVPRRARPRRTSRALDHPYVARVVAMVEGPEVRLIQELAAGGTLLGAARARRRDRRARGAVLRRLSRLGARAPPQAQDRPPRRQPAGDLPRRPPPPAHRQAPPRQAPRRRHAHVHHLRRLSTWRPRCSHKGYDAAVDW